MKKVIAKASGDLSKKDSVLLWYEKISQESVLTICTGGGTQINMAFKERGYPIEFGEKGRICETQEQNLLAYEVLENNKKDLEDLLATRNIKAAVVIPAFIEGGAIRHVNGDEYLCDAEGYDKKYVLTLTERVVDKRSYFAKLSPEIEVVGFD